MLNPTPCSASIRPSRFRFLALAALLLLLPSSARAQLVSVYGTFSAARSSNVVNGNTFGLNPTFTYGSYWSEGFGGGATFSPLHLGPLSLGLDVRGSGSSKADTAMAGIKAGVKLPFLPLRPYVEAAGGYLRTKIPVTVGLAPATDTTGYYAYEVLGGLDYTVLPHIDVRLVEIGGGQGSYESGPNANIPSVSLFTVNSGVVIRF
jgi:hypothetical protein